MHLLGCISSTVQEMHPQVLSKTPIASEMVLGLDGGEVPAGKSQSSSSNAPPVPDDDGRDLIPEVPRPKVHGNPEPNPAAKAEQTKAAPVQGAKRRPPKIHPALYAWMRTRILTRAGNVAKPHAYVRAAQDEFLASLPIEVEEYLTEKAQEFLSERARQNPDVTVSFRETFSALDEDARKHHLPLSKGIYDRAARAASDLLGWTVTMLANETPSMGTRIRNSIAKSLRDMPTNKKLAQPSARKKVARCSRFRWTRICC